MVHILKTLHAKVLFLMLTLTVLCVMRITIESSALGLIGYFTLLDASKERGATNFRWSVVYSNNSVNRRLAGKVCTAILTMPRCSKPKKRQLLPHYPVNGTGVTINISRDFDASIFNTFCNMNKNMTTVIPVYSAAENFDRRAAIRDTIGKECEENNCRVFFIVGVPCIPRIYGRIMIEYQEKGDILMINKVDTYWDLNNKAVAMLEFLVKFCPHPQYVLHIVDDTYPNIKYFLSQLDAIKDKESKFILGHVLYSFKVHRDPRIKGFVSEKEYSRRLFPKFVMGLAYAFLNSDSHTLLDNVHSADYIWIEDVWLTGMVRIKSGFKFIAAEKPRKISCTAKDPLLWETFTNVHKVCVKGFYEIYNITHGLSSENNITKR